jgi:hypothetical protein
MSLDKTKSLSKYEKLICELTWGGVPEDTTFVRNSNLFKQTEKNYDSILDLVSKTGTNLEIVNEYKCIKKFRT